MIERLDAALSSNTPLDFHYRQIQFIRIHSPAFTSAYKERFYPLALFKSFSRVFTRGGVVFCLGLYIRVSAVGTLSSAYSHTVLALRSAGRL